MFFNNFSACVSCILNRPVAAAFSGAPPLPPWHSLFLSMLMASEGSTCDFPPECLLFTCCRAGWWTPAALVVNTSRSCLQPGVHRSESITTPASWPLRFRSGHVLLYQFPRETGPQLPIVGTFFLTHMLLPFLLCVPSPFPCCYFQGSALE